MDIRWSRIIVEGTILSLMNGLGILVENQMAVDIWIYFWYINQAVDV